MDLSTVNIYALNTSTTSSRRARSTSPARREEWRISGKYIRCGSSNHQINLCLLAPAKDRLLSPRLYQRFTPQEESYNKVILDSASDSSFNEYWRDRPLSPQYSAIKQSLRASFFKGGGNITAPLRNLVRGSLKTWRTRIQTFPFFHLLLLLSLISSSLGQSNHYRFTRPLCRARGLD